MSARVAWPVFLAVLVGIAGAFAMALRTSPLDRMRPEYTTDVLAQKARDAVRQLVSPERAARRSDRVRVEQRSRRARDGERQTGARLEHGLHAASFTAGVLVPAEQRAADRRHVPQRLADAWTRPPRRSAADHVGHEPRRAGPSGPAHILRNDPGAKTGCPDTGRAGGLDASLHAGGSGHRTVEEHRAALDLARRVGHTGGLDRHMAGQRAAVARGSRRARGTSGGIHGDGAMAETVADGGAVGGSRQPDHRRVVRDDVWHTRRSRTSWRERTCAADVETFRARRASASAWPPS